MDQPRDAVLTACCCFFSTVLSLESSLTFRMKAPTPASSVRLLCSGEIQHQPKSHKLLPSFNTDSCPAQLWTCERGQLYSPGDTWTLTSVHILHLCPFVSSSECQRPWTPFWSYLNPLSSGWVRTRPLFLQTCPWFQCLGPNLSL